MPSALISNCQDELVTVVALLEVLLHAFIVYTVPEELRLRSLSKKKVVLLY